MPGFTIGQVAKRVGISTDTIRLYERQRLIDTPQRAENNYRLYTETTLAQLCFIKRAKAMGFTLKEISELLEIKHTASNTCEEVQHQAESKLAVIEQKLIELKRLKKALTALINTCHEKGRGQDCPLLILLEQPTEGEYAPP